MALYFDCTSRVWRIWGKIVDTLPFLTMTPHPSIVSSGEKGSSNVPSIVFVLTLAGLHPASIKPKARRMLRLNRYFLSIRICYLKTERQAEGDGQGTQIAGGAQLGIAFVILLLFCLQEPQFRLQHLELGHGTAGSAGNLEGTGVEIVDLHGTMEVVVQSHGW